MRLATSAGDVLEIARLLRALSDETRLRVVALLAAGELCVCVIHECLDLPQSNVSRHLAVLRSAGLVEARRDGKWIYYRLREQQDKARARLLQSIAGSLSTREPLVRKARSLLAERTKAPCR